MPALEVYNLFGDVPLLSEGTLTLSAHCHAVAPCNGALQGQLSLLHMTTHSARWLVEDAVTLVSLLQGYPTGWRCTVRLSCSTYLVYSQIQLAQLYNMQAKDQTQWQ